VSVLVIVAVVDGDVVTVGSLVCDAVIDPERVVRAVAVPERLSTADRVSFADPDVVLEFEEVAVAEPEGDPETVSATDVVAEADATTERV
jgi:hypothetical protein